MVVDHKYIYIYIVCVALRKKISFFFTYVSIHMSAPKEIAVPTEMDLVLHPHLLALWGRCRTFVEKTCHGRGESHGLQHMEHVTMQALMLYAMCSPEEKVGRVWENTTVAVAPPTPPQTATTTSSPFPPRTSASVPTGETTALPLLRTLPTSLPQYRIILTGMLHDVADHKYDDAEGSLEKQVRQFATTECEQLVVWMRQEQAAASSNMDNEAPREETKDRNASGGETSAVFTAEERDSVLSPNAEANEVVQREVQQLMLAIAAISFSKEKKWGRNWFTDAQTCQRVLGGREELASTALSSILPLTSAWLTVRHCVSDADKLEALGEKGLVRCYAYMCEATAKKYKENALSPPAPHLTPKSMESTMLEEELFHDVEVHFQEKLSILSSEYTRTTPGKELSQIKEKEMIMALERWRREGPPSALLYWL